MKQDSKTTAMPATPVQREDAATWLLRCLGLCLCALAWVLLCAALAPGSARERPAPRGDNPLVLFASGARMGLRALHAANVDASRQGPPADAAVHRPAAAMP